MTLLLGIDAWYADRPEPYQRFRTWFLDAYRQSARSEIGTDRIDHAIAVRARALERWLADRSRAPGKIRSPRWHGQLRSFAADVRSRTT